MTAQEYNISEQVEAGVVFCKVCSLQTTEPVGGWFFVSNGDSYCQEHTPLGGDLDFGPLS